MGRSSGVVFGFGAVVPMEEYVKLFPGTFKFDSKTNEWDVRGRGPVGSDLVEIFYSAGEPSKNVFIATKSSVSYFLEKGYVTQTSMDVSLEEINDEAIMLQPWLLETFPGHNVGYMMYGFEVD